MVLSDLFHIIYNCTIPAGGNEQLHCTTGKDEIQMVLGKINKRTGENKPKK
jgi:hypothetical protein